MLLCRDWVFGRRANAEIRVLGGFAKTCQNFSFYQVDLTLHVNALILGKRRREERNEYRLASSSSSSSSSSLLPVSIFITYSSTASEGHSDLDEIDC